MTLFKRIKSVKRSLNSLSEKPDLSFQKEGFILRGGNPYVHKKRRPIPKSTVLLKPVVTLTWVRLWRRGRRTRVGAIYGPRDGDKKALSERNRPKAGNRPNRLSWVFIFLEKSRRRSFFTIVKNSKAIVSFFICGG